MTVGGHHEGWLIVLFFALLLVGPCVNAQARQQTPDVVWFSMETGALPHDSQWQAARTAMMQQLESAGFSVVDRPVAHNAVIRAKYTDKCYLECGATLIFEKPQGRQIVKEEMGYGASEGKRYYIFEYLGEFATGVLRDDTSGLMRLARDRDKEICGTAIRRLTNFPNAAVVKVMVDVMEEQSSCTFDAATALCSIASKRQDRNLFSPLLEMDKRWAALEISKPVNYFIVVDIKKGGAWLLGEIGDPAGLASLDKIDAPQLQPVVSQAKAKITKNR